LNTVASIKNKRHSARLDAGTELSVHRTKLSRPDVFPDNGFESEIFEYACHSQGVIYWIRKRCALVVGVAYQECDALGVTRILGKCKCPPEHEQKPGC
jgi:hypothetical protein